MTPIEMKVTGVTTSLVTEKTDEFAIHRAVISVVLAGLLVVPGVLVISRIAAVHPSIMRQLWLLAPTIMASVIVWLAWKTVWQSAAVAMAIGILGYSAALATYVDTAWLQRIAPPRDLMSLRRGGFFAIVLLQGAVVIWWGRRIWRDALPRIARWLTSPIGLLIATIYSVGAVCFMRYVRGSNIAGYFAELCVTLPILLLGAANLALAAALTPALGMESLRNWAGNIFATTRNESQGYLGRRLNVLAAGWVVVISSLLAVLTFERIPQIPDDVSMYWQAKYFSAGHLYLNPPPSETSFHQYLVVNNGSKWYAHSTPGWPMLLAMGFLAGTPWLVNPIIGGATLLLLHRVVWRLHGWRAAQVSALFLACSPWYLVMSATYLQHPSSLLWTIASFASAEAYRRRGLTLHAALTGMSLGLLVLARPFDAIPVMLVVGVWLAPSLLRKGKKRDCVAITAVFGALAAAALYYNNMVTGSPWVLPTTPGIATEYQPEHNRLGFGPDRGFGWPMLDPRPGHDLIDVGINANHNLYWLGFETFGWPCGSLVLVLMGVSLARPRGIEWLWWGLIGAVVSLYSLYWFSGGPDYGARYWYTLLPAIVALSAVGLRRLCEKWPISPIGHTQLGLAVTCACLIGLSVVLPWRAVNKYPQRRGMHTDLAKLEREFAWKNALIFVHAKNPEEYSAAFIRNAPILNEGQVIYARDVSPVVNAELVLSYPHRNTWTIGISDQPGGGYWVARGIQGTKSASRQSGVP